MMAAAIPIVAAAALEAGLPIPLLLGVAEIESGGHQNSVSPVGAIGLLQLMPATAAHLHVNPYDARDNARGGAWFLKWLIGHYGAVDLALAAYNWGPTNVDHALEHGTPIPGEVVHYVNNVLAAQAKFGGISPAVAMMQPSASSSASAGIGGGGSTVGLAALALAWWWWSQKQQRRPAMAA